MIIIWKCGQESTAKLFPADNGLPQVNNLGAGGNLRLVELESRCRQRLVFVAGDFDDVDRFVAHLKACRAQQRGRLVKVEPQCLDAVFLLGSEFMAYVLLVWALAFFMLKLALK